MRRVAAEARRVLLEMAGQRLGVPVDLLAVSNATISLKSDPARQVTYAELVGGKRFNVALTGRNVDATTGKATVKPVNELRVVGQSLQRYDIPAKVDGSLKWAVDVKLPGMVHARNVRPPVAGATLCSASTSRRWRIFPGSSGRQQRQLRRRRLRARRAGHPRRHAAEGRMEEAGDGAVPGLRRPVQLHARRRTHVDARAPGAG